MDLQNKMYRVGKLIAGGSATSATVQMIAPQTNREGIILQTGAFSANNLSTSFLVADTQLSATPVTSSLVIFAVTTQSATAGIWASIPFPVYIPPGLGLYLYAESNFGSAYVTYDLLNSAP